MARTARLAISADRYTPCIRTFVFRGIDLTGAGLQMSIRPSPDTPGPALVDLVTVTNANAEGLRLVGVDLSGPVPISTVAMKINETTMAGLPYSGEVGDLTELAYDWQVTLSYKRVVMAGAFLVVPGVVGANDAPLNRPAGFSRAMGASGDFSTATLTFGPDVTEVTLDGVDLLGPIVGEAQAAAAEATAAAAAAGQAGGSILLTRTNASASDIQATMPAGAIIRPIASELVMIAPAAPDGQSGVDLTIAGFNDGDRRPIIRSDGALVEAAAWAAGDRLSLYYDTSVHVGKFVLVSPPRAATPATSEYQQIALSHARMGA